MFYIIFRFCDNVDVKTLTRKQSNSFEKDFTNFKIFSSFNHDGNILSVKVFHLCFSLTMATSLLVHVYIPSNKFTVSCCFYARVYLCMECKGISDYYRDPCIQFRFLHEIGIPYHFFTRRNHFFVVCNIRFLLTVFVGKNVLHRTFLIGNSARN